MNLILDATEQLLLDRDFEEISVQEIIAHSRTSVGSFYGRFPTKESLFQCLIERYLEEREVTLLELLSDGDWERIGLKARIEAMVDIAIRFNRERPGLMRALAVRRMRGMPLRQNLADEYRPRVDQWIEFLLACRDEITHPHPDQGVQFALVAGQAVLNQLTLVDEDCRMTKLKLSERGLKQQMVRLILHHLID